MSVVEFKRPKKEPEETQEELPHMECLARCIACKHEWHAVAPVGTVWLECPSCGTEKGVFKFHGERSGLHWTCACENQLFYIMEDGAYCPNCGDWQSW